MEYNRYIIEYGIPGCVSGANTIDDLKRYLESHKSGPHPLYRLVSCESLDSGNFLLVWEVDERKLGIKLSEDFV